MKETKKDEWEKPRIQLAVYGRRTMSPEVKMSILKKKKDGSQIDLKKFETLYEVDKEWLELTLKSGYVRTYAQHVQNCPTIEFETWEKEITQSDFEKGTISAGRKK